MGDPEADVENEVLKIEQERQVGLAFNSLEFPLSKQRLWISVRK